jgi:4'-phosphopantetheinyl transferase
MTRVDVWCVDLVQPADVVAGLDRLLTDAERSRARRFLRPLDGDRHTVAHGALRDILARYVGMPADRLEFDATKSGKPALTDAGPHFSLSHSEGHALVAVSGARPVGVDLERMRDDDDLEAVARRVFTPAERTLLAGTDESARHELFFRVWTCKEACLKESGRGIEALGAVETSLAGDGALSARDANGHFAVTELRPAPGYAGAVAVRGGEVTAQLLEWDRQSSCSGA